MSIPKTASQPTKPMVTKTSKQTISQSDREELKLLDAACARLNQVIPETPRHLTIPVESRFEYNHWDDRERKAWREGTFFEPHEERRQYLSLLYEPPRDTLIETRTEVDEERERRQRLGVNGSASGSSTPLARPTGLPKRKINLSDYKAKLAGSKSAATATPSKKEPESTKAPAMTRDIKKEPARVPAEQAKATHGHKRPLDDDAAGAKVSNTTVVSDEPPVKKARASSPVKPPSQSPKRATQPSTPHGLPPLISPIRGEAPPYGLPAMLSPSLPPAIEDELSRMSEHPETQPGTPTSTEKPAQSKPQIKADPIANKIANSLKKSEEAMKRVSELEDRKSQHNATHEKIKERPPAARADQDVEATAKRRQRYIVKLKYGKKNRKRVEQILKLPSKNARQADARARSESTAPRLDKSNAQEKTRVESTNNGAAHHRDSISSAAGKDSVKPSQGKRKHPDDDTQDQQDVKRQRALSALDADKRPSTPLQSTAKSPNLASVKSSAQKPNNHLTATPRKDFQGVKMQRSISAESSTVRTPQAAGSTPRPQPTSAPNGRATDIEQWSALSKKYNDLGRKIKHEWEAIGKQRSLSPNDNKRSAVLALQCILCYMLAFHCKDTGSRLQRRPCSLETTWISMLPLWTTFHRVCQPFPHLEGLRFYLGLAIRNAIAMTTADRINLARKAGGEATDHAAAAAAARNGSNASDAPTPTPSSGGGGGAAASGVPSLENIRENSVELAKNAREAAVRLSPREIIRAFPGTWAAAEDDDANRPAVGSYEKDPGELLGGKFWLPVCADTTPVQAVRFGLKLLKEWVEKEKLNVEMFLK